MSHVSDPSRFTAALVAYFGNGTDPGYLPGSSINGKARVAAEFPQYDTVLNTEIDQLFDAAYSLPDLWRESLDDSLEKVRMFIVSEYDFLPPPLQSKIVDCCSYSLYK